jgi:hypothetical protein
MRIACGLLFALGAATALADGMPGVALLGSGFTGKPFVIKDDLVAESDGLRETLRDFSNPREPVVVGWYSHATSAYWEQVLAADGLLVALTGDQPGSAVGYEVVDVSDLLAPRALGTFAGMLFDSGWMRGRALTMSSGTVLITYDLADPTAPVLSDVSFLGAHSGSRWPAEVGNTLFLIDHGATVCAMDVNDPYHPESLGVATLGGVRIDALAGGDGVLYAAVAQDVGTGNEHVDLVTSDVSAPASPVETDRQLLVAGDGAGIRSMARTGDLLLIAGSDGLVRAFGLADPGHPAAGWTLAHDSGHLAASTSAVMVAVGDEVFTYPRTAFDAVPPEPTVRSALPLLRTVEGRGPVQLSQLHYENNFLVPVDVSDPYHPRLGAPVDLEFNGRLQVSGRTGMLADGSQAALLDLEDPLQPVLVKVFGIADSWAYFQLASADLATLSDVGEGEDLWLYDISDPLKPTKASEIDEIGFMGLDGSLMAAGYRSHVRLYDISDLAQPKAHGVLPDPGLVTHVCLWSDHAYVTTTRDDGVRSLDTYDLTDLEAPVLASTLELPMVVSRMDRHGSSLYVQGYSTLQVIELSNPAAPALLGGLYRHNGWFAGFAVNGNVATISSDLITMRIDGMVLTGVPASPAPATVRLEPAVPNPFNPTTRIVFTVDRERELAVTVHDVRGRAVTELARGSFTAGPHEVVWNGADGAGAPVASGVYLVRLHGEGVESFRTVTLLK